MALATAPATGNIIMSTLLDKVGVASEINDTTSELGGAIGVALGGSLVWTIYSALINLTSLGLPQAANEPASQSIGGAFGATVRIGGETGIQIIRAAQEAYVTAFAWAMGIGAVVAIFAGIVTWQSMRGRDRETEKL